MANTVGKPTEQSKIRKILMALHRMMKFFLIFILLLAVLGAGFAAGVYFKFIDIDQLAAKWNLQQYPVVGKYFRQSQTNFEPVELIPEPEAAVKQSTASTIIPVLPKPSAVREQDQSQPQAKPPLDAAELEKQEAQKKQEELKRLTKVSRLYDGMKPEEAAPILNELDDATIIMIFGKMDEEKVAKVMTLFDAKRAARLSQAMLKGRPGN